MLIIQTQPMIIFTRLLEILVTKCLLLVVGIQVQVIPTPTTKLKSLTSTRIHGKHELPSRIVQSRTFKFFKNFFLNSFLLLFRICNYGLVSQASSVLIFGGWCQQSVEENYVSTSLIARYTLDKWELVGNLQQARHGHRAISNGDRIYVVGGYGHLRCEISHFFNLKFCSFSALKFGH